MSNNALPLRGRVLRPLPAHLKLIKANFGPPRITKKLARALTPSHLSTIKNISGISAGLASGEMGADELASMNLAKLQARNKAMRDFNEKAIKKLDAADKKNFKGHKKSPTPLASLLEKAKSGLRGEGPSSDLASLKMNTKSSGAGKTDKGEDGEKKTGVTKTNPYGKSGHQSARNTNEEYDFNLSGAEDVKDKRELAVNSEKSLDDFVINHDDINKRKDVSIFKILSNRYLLSYPKVLEEK